MEEKQLPLEERIVLSVEDFNDVANFIYNTPLPYSKTEAIVAILRRGVRMKIRIDGITPE